MKKKIYKVLGVMLALAIVMSTCVCAMWNASADDAAITFTQGTIDAGVVKTSGNRAYTADALLKADYESVTFATGYKGYFHFYDADDAYLGNYGKWVEQTTLTTAAMPSGAVYFRVVLGKTDNADFTPADLNGSEVTFKEAGFYVQGNVQTANNKFEINGTVGTRVTTRKLLALDDYSSVTFGTNMKGFLYAYKEDGTLMNTNGSGWVTGTYSLSGLDTGDAVYFSVTVAYSDNANITPDTVPEGALTFAEAVKLNPTAAMFGQGNVLTSAGNLTLNSGTAHRVTTKELLALADYDSVTMASGYKAWFYAYKEDGTLVDTTGIGWKEGTFSLSSVAGLSSDAVYFSVTLAYTDNANLTPADLPENAITFTEAVKLNPIAALFVNGTVDGSTGKVSSANHRAYTKDALVLGDYEKVTIASGWKAYVQHYDIDGNWLSSGGKWVEQTEFTTADMPQAAAYFRFTLAKMDNANFVPADIPEEAVVFTEAPECAGHTYDNDCDALCNLCRRPREVGDHVYDNACDAECNNCGATREVGDHVYENYVSNGDATCEADGTKTGTCACGATDTITDEGSKLDHVYENYVSNGDATCEADGTKTGTCACGATDTITDEGSKLDHVYENYVSNGDATCEADGTKTGTCACGATDTITDEGSKLDHVYENYVSNGDATCEADGTKTGTCACGATDTITDEGSKLDHTYENYTSNGDATCTADGTKTGTCVCGKTDTIVDEGSKLDHTYENYTYNNDATCTANGTETGTCVCSATDTREVADTMLDHSWKRPTCTEPKTCGGCGATVGEAFGHDYDTSYDKDCNVCGAVREAAAITDIEIRDGKIYIEGKTSVKGLFCVDGEYYFADWGGVIKTGGKFYVKTSYCDLEGGKEYLFGEDGKMVHEEIIDGILYIHGRTASKGIYKIDGEYYFSTWGGVIEGGLQTTSYVENCDLPAGTYRFDENGKMLDNALYIDENGVKYIYVKGRTCVPGLYEIDGQLYAATWGGVVRTDGRYFVKNSFCDEEANGYFYCDANGFAEAI